MKLGVAIAHALPSVDVSLDLVRHAEQLGYDSVWSAELYGSDAFTPLAFLAAHTTRIKLGTGLIQLAARTPANVAMTAATLDQLAGGGRVIVGIGVSGPQIVEGWYGQTWGSPVQRMRDYVAIIRKILAREPAVHAGPEIRLPYVAPAGAQNPASAQPRPLKLILHPPAPIPIYLGCGGQASTALTGEVADGWLPLGLTPDNWDTYLPHLERGAQRSGRDLGTLQIQGSASVVVTNDVEGALAAVKPGIAMRVGGYGSSTHNFHRDAMIRRGHADLAEKVSALFTDGRRDEAAQAIPDEYVDATGLYGSHERISERWARYASRPYSGLTIRTDDIETLEFIADLNLATEPDIAEPHIPRSNSPEPPQTGTD